MILSIAKHEIELSLLSKRIWFALSGIVFGFAVLYEWLLKQYIIVSQAHILEGGIWNVTEEVLHPYFAWIAIFCVFSLPILSCYSIIRDKKSGSILLYQIAPLPKTKYLFGHVVARLSFSYLVLGLLSLFPCVVAIDTKIDWLQFASAYLGILLLATSIICVSIFAAVVSSNILTAVGITYGVIVFLSFLEWFAQFAPNYYLFIRSISFLYPIKNFLSGNIFIVDIAYYAYISVMALFGATIILNYRDDSHAG